MAEYEDMGYNDEMYDESCWEAFSCLTKPLHSEAHLSPLGSSPYFRARWRPSPLSLHSNELTLTPFFRGHVLNATAVGVAFRLPLLGSMSPRVAHGVEFVDVMNGKATPVVCMEDPEMIPGLGFSPEKAMDPAVVTRIAYGSQSDQVKLVLTWEPQVLCEPGTCVCSGLVPVQWYRRGGGTIVFVFQWWYLVMVAVQREFLQRYRDRVGPSLSITDLMAEKMKVEEDFLHYADRWRALAKILRDPLSESEQVKMITANATPQFRHILAMNKLRARYIQTQLKDSPIMAMFEPKARTMKKNNGNPSTGGPTTEGVMQNEQLNNLNSLHLNTSKLPLHLSTIKLHSLSTVNLLLNTNNNHHLHNVLNNTTNWHTLEARFHFKDYIYDLNDNGGIDSEEMRKYIAEMKARRPTRIHVSQCLVDTGASINVVSLDTLSLCGVTLQSVRPFSVTVTAYDNTSRPPKGVIALKVGLGPSITEIDFHILDMDPSFRMILGRPFIQAHGVVTSTIHQCLKFPYKGRVVKVSSKPIVLEVDAMTDISIPSIWLSNQPLMSVLDMYDMQQNPVHSPSVNAAKRSKIMTEKDDLLAVDMQPVSVDRYIASVDNYCSSRDRRPSRDMVVPELPAATGLVVHVATGVSVASLSRSCSVDAACQTVARDPSWDRDDVAVGEATATLSRCPGVPRPGRVGYGYRDSVATRLVPCERLLPLPGNPILGRLRGRYRGDECARVGSPAGGLRSLGENGGLDGGVESFAELSWLDLGHRGRLEFYPVQISQSFSHCLTLCGPETA
ncbi:hypothetical protein Taro_003351 [Colocasia esculenta]|uniref:EF-hand domain-containing protein n=1 Tax=Colocasia esculenta TaxID=4460 RepID=A0A843TF71_COLES|nr:hypothetical protein [Colocasia esculenta]